MKLTCLLGYIEGTVCIYGHCLIKIELKAGQMFHFSNLKNKQIHMCVLICAFVCKCICVHMFVMYVGMHMEAQSWCLVPFSIVLSLSRKDHFWNAALKFN